MNTALQDAVSVVIPLIPQHDSEMKRIFRTLSSQSYFIAEVVICRSESMGSEKRILKKFQKVAIKAQFNKPIRVSCVREIARDGTNRNRGWSMVKSKYTAFIDADDIYHPARLRRLLELLESSGADAILHNYNSDGLSNIFNDKNEPLRYCVATLKQEPQENQLKLFVDQDGNDLKMHFAHLTLRTTLRERLHFSSRFPGADWQMSNDIAESGFTILYAIEELSAWKRDRTLRYRLRLLRHACVRVFSLKKIINLSAANRRFMG